MLRGGEGPGARLRPRRTSDRTGGAGAALIAPPAARRGLGPRRIARALEGRTEAALWAGFLAAKRAGLRLRRPGPEAHILVFGCQRSGTTLMQRLFEADPRAAVFGEFGPLSVDPSRTLWRPLAEVAAHLMGQRGRYTLARPLHASHRAAAALEAIPRSLGVWLYRDAPSVVRSMMEKWGGEFRMVSERVEADPAGRWDLRTVWDALEAEAEAEVARAGGPANAERLTRGTYALFWLHRNAGYFAAAAALPGRLLLVDHAALVRDPAGVVARILGHAGIAPAARSYPVATRLASRHAGPLPAFSAPIAARCDALLARLAAASAAAGSAPERRHPPR